MTSNIGVRDLKDFGSGIGFASAAKRESDEEHMKTTIQNALKRAFSPEFLNRLDDLIVFNSLQREHPVPPFRRFLPRRSTCRPVV